MKYIDYNENDIQEFEYETTMISDNSIVGACELGKATIKLLNDSNEYSVFKGSWIKTVHGSFYIYDVKPVQEKINIELTCYDIKYKLDTLYEPKKYTFPLTLKNWRNSIFNNCGVKYDDSDFPNSDLILEKEPYIENGSSNRTVIKMIAQAGASSVITDKNDIFYFSWFTDNVFLVDDWLELTTEKVKTDSINTVVLGRGDTEDNVYYPEQTQNPIEFRIDNNYILDPQDTDSDTDIRYKTIKPIYNRINGFSYLIFDIRTQQIDNKLSLTLGDKIKYYDIYDNELEAYVMTKKITYLGGDLSDDTNYEMTLSAEKVNETSTDLSYSSKIDSKILSVERKADKQAGIILDEVKKIDSTLNSITTTNKTVSNKNSLYIENSLEENALEFRVKGKSEQNTSTQGKNYFTGNKLASGTNVGITYDFDNSIIKLNGTTTGNNVICTDTTKIKVPAGTYNYSLGLKSGSFIRNGNDLAIYLMSSSTEFITGSYSTSGRTLRDIENNSSNRTNINFTTTKDIELYVRIYTNGAGIVCENVELEVQLEPGKTMTAFEQFVPDSPNPDYPQEIKSVNGVENLLPNNLEQGSWYGNTLDRVANYSNIWLEPGTYTFLTNIDTTKFNIWLGICKVKSPQSTWSNITTIKNWSSFKTLTFTTTTGGYFLDMFSKKDGTNITSNELSDLQQHLVNGATLPKTYVPHGNWLVEKVTGKNKFDKNNTVVGYLNADGTINSADGTYRTSNFISIKPNIAYYKSQTLSSRIKFYDKNKKPLNTTTYQDITGGDSATSFTTPDNAYYLRLTIRNRSTDTYIDALQLEQNTEPTEYEPYKEQQVLINLKGNELCSTKDLSVRDELAVTENETYIDKKIGKIILDGSDDENWLFTDNNQRVRTSSVYIPKLSNVKINKVETSNNLTYALSNYYTISTQTDVKPGSNKMGFSQWGNVKFLYLPADYTLAEFKSQLQANPVTIYYVLETPEKIELDKVDIPLFENINNLTLLEDLETDTSVKYLTNNSLNQMYATRAQLEITDNSIRTDVNSKFKDYSTTTEMNNTIEQKITDSENAISLKVEQVDKKTDNLQASLELKIGKNDNDEIVSMLNASAKEINLKSNRFSLESDKSKISKDGTVKFTGGTIGGFELTENEFKTNISVTRNYTQNDLNRVQQYLLGQATLTNEEIDYYDANGDGIINLLDLLLIQKIISGTDSATRTGTFELNSSSSLKSLRFKDSTGQTTTSIGLDGIGTKNISADTISVNDIRKKDGNPYFSSGCSLLSNISSYITSDILISYFGEYDLYIIIGKIASNDIGRATAIVPSIALSSSGTSINIADNSGFVSGLFTVDSSNQVLFRHRARSGTGYIEQIFGVKL